MFVFLQRERELGESATLCVLVQGAEEEHKISACLQYLQCQYPFFQCLTLVLSKYLLLSTTAHNTLTVLILILLIRSGLLPRALQVVLQQRPPLFVHTLFYFLSSPLSVGLLV